ncbi:hypothetical protein ACFQ0G_38440 [Streptomyces chiangmaiensis]
MARIRTVKPDLFVNERVAACSVTAVVTYIGLFTQSDDHGRHRDNPAIIAGLLWPLRAEHTPVHVEEDLQQLADGGLICRYSGCDGKRYLHITGWYEHQKIDRPSQSRLPVCVAHHGDKRCGPCKGICVEAGASPREASLRPRRTIDEPSTRVLHHPRACPATAPQRCPSPGTGSLPTGRRPAARARKPQVRAVSVRSRRMFTEGSTRLRRPDPGSWILDLLHLRGAQRLAPPRPRISSPGT